MSILDNLTSYIGLADIDYISARLLILSGLPNTGLSKAAEAFEKLLKLFLILHEKIAFGKEISVQDLKNYSHNLNKLVRKFNSVAPTHMQLDESWEYLATQLQTAYNRRYPEDWKEWEMIVEIDKIDQGYVFLRNLCKNNFPAELKERAQDFGTFIFDAYSTEFLQKISGNELGNPVNALVAGNNSLENLDINPSFFTKLDVN